MVEFGGVSVDGICRRVRVVGVWGRVVGLGCREFGILNLGRRL